MFVVVVVVVVVVVSSLWSLSSLFLSKSLALFLLLSVLFLSCFCLEACFYITGCFYLCIFLSSSIFHLSSDTFSIALVSGILCCSTDNLRNGCVEEAGPAGVDSTLPFENPSNMINLPIIKYDQKQVRINKQTNKQTNKTKNKNVKFLMHLKSC